MPNLNSLVSQPQSSQPPDVQGASGTAQPSGIQQAMAPQGGAPQGGGFQAPNHHETVALLQHMSAFRRGWVNILKDPEIGEANVRPKIYDFVADMMNDGYITLPQVMNFIKTIPDTPLEQKQFIEKQVANDDQATIAVLHHHGQAAQAGLLVNDSMAPTDKERGELVNNAVARYKAHGKRNKPQPRGIPLA